MVDFCEKCGAIIMGKKGESVKCPSCGYENESKSDLKLSEKIEIKNEKEIISSDIGDNINPITTVECPKCGHMEAYYWTKQTRAGDEPETQFFKCVDCSHQWRDYR